VLRTQLLERKVLDKRRWYCVTRPQYPKTCGMSSLVSCWNFLFSYLGAGTHRPISIEEAIEAIDSERCQVPPPYTGVSFGSFTGNYILFEWFEKLN